MRSAAATKPAPRHHRPRWPRCAEPTNERSPWTTTNTSRDATAAPSAPQAGAARRDRRWWCSAPSPTARTGRWCCATTSPPTTPTCRRRWCRSRRRSAGTVLAIAGRRHRRRQGRPAVGQARPGRRPVALERAEAQLAQTVREVRTLYANNGALRPQIEAARGRCRTHARAEMARANDDVVRRRPLMASGAVGRRRDAPRRSRSSRRPTARSPARAVGARRRARAGGQQPRLTDGTGVEQAPQRRNAPPARCARPGSALQRTELPAPVAG